jgi:predicted unusual protein kinase regulating ubiquinone biosynthesis (AarF/ABC1/UbiB family)
VEFLEGQTVLNHLRRLSTDAEGAAHDLRRIGCDPNRVAASIVDNFVLDVFRHGLFHADLHPANLLILADNAIGYIDFGITGTISRYSRDSLIALTLACTRGDVAGMTEAFFRVSTPEKGFDPNRFREGLERASKTWYITNGSKRRLRKNFTLVMLDMTRLSRETGITPAGDIVKYIRSSVAIDGLITRMAPRFDLAAHLERTCSHHLQSELQREMFGRERLIDFAVSSMNLMASGGNRAATLLGRPFAETPVSGGRNRRPGPARTRRRLLWLAAMVVAVSMLASGEPPHWGWNAFTVDAGLLAGVSALLLWTLRNLAAEI